MAKLVGFGVNMTTLNTTNSKVTVIIQIMEIFKIDNFARRFGGIF